MPSKKTKFGKDEEPVFDDAVIYKRGDYWHFRLWLENERKYARFSLKTRNKDTAIDKAKKHYHELKAMQHSGKTYFSKTVKDGVLEYLAQRELDLRSGLIVKGRLGTIRTHLNHWLDFIGRDTKLKELERTCCENYYSERTKTKKKIRISQTTVLNEQSTINAMILWHYKRGNTYIDGFDFKPLKRIDRGDATLRRSTFEDKEMKRLVKALHDYIKEGQKDINDDGNLTKVLCAYFFLIASITGLRRGEQLQLRWKDIEWLDKNIEGEDEDEVYSLVKLTVRAETSKVRKTRRFAVKDWEYFSELFKILQPRYKAMTEGIDNVLHFSETLIFSKNGKSSITPRVILNHFDKVLNLAEIDIWNGRNLVPNSFRHTFITQLINRGAAIMQVAEICGTSANQIEKTYYHTTDRKIIENAMIGFTYVNNVLIAD